MPYARPNRTSMTPRPAAHQPKRAVVIAGPQNPAATLAESTSGWNFAVRVWIAFDAPTAATPNWIDISGFVEQQQSLTINHGRTDLLSDVNASTCSLTVDNSDGRFSAANPNGVWYGQVHKGNWLKVEIFPPSGAVSTRFVGFITSLPNQWQGQYQTGLITASDRFEKLGRAAAIISSIQSEVLTDPNLAGNVKAYWNLHEAQGSLTFGDTSGSLSHYLSMVGFNTSAGVGFGAANANGPGFDGIRCPTFNPVSTTQGTYLTAPITTTMGTWSSGPAYSGLEGVVSFWYQATSTAQQILVSLVDNTAQFAFSILQLSGGLFNGNLQVAYISTAQSRLAGYSVAIAPYNVADGKWHHIAVAVAAASSLGGVASATIYIDGNAQQGGTQTGISGANGNLTQINIGAGYDPNAPGAITLGAGNISDVSWYWGDAMETFGSGPALPPDFASHYTAGSTGFLGESTDQRIARVARYAGVPIPLVSVPTNSSYSGNIQQYNPVQGPWTNLSVGVHSCGTQNMAGRKPLDVMQEAAHTEAMPLYVDRSGYLAIQPSTTRQNTSPAWSVNALELDPSTQVADDFAYVTNQMTITPNGQAAQTVIGAAGSAGRLSQAKYDVADGSQATASLNPVEAQSLGLGYIQLRADPVPRLAPLAVDVATTALLPGYGAAWYDAVLATEISTPIRVTNAPAAIGGGTYDCLVEGWSETITTGNHLIAFTTSQIQGPTYQLDDAVLGRLDTDGTTLQGALTTSATTFTAAVATATSAAWTVSTSDFPFDILMDTEQMTVSSIAPVSLGVDGTFETSATGWTLTGCTLAQSTAQAHSGTHSGLMTATTTGVVTAVTPQFAVYPNATYQPSHWFYLASGAPNNDQVTVSWYTSGAVLISSVVSPYFLTPQSFWRQQAFSVTAPSNAAFATVKIQFTAAAIGDAIYIDDAVFTLLTGGQQSFTVTRSVNGVVASHTSGAALALAEPLTLAY